MDDGWSVSAQRPQAYPGSPWTDTSRAPAGATVMSTGAATVRSSPSRTNETWICKVLDTEYVEFAAARVNLKKDAQPNLYYDTSYDGEVTLELWTPKLAVDDILIGPLLARVLLPGEDELGDRLACDTVSIVMAMLGGKGAALSVDAD